VRLGGYVKTAAMAAGERVDSPLFLLDYALRILRVLILLALWRTLLAGRETEGLMSLQSVLTYTLIAEVFAEQIAARTTLVEAFWEGTTIKLLCGLLAPDGGRVRALGIDPVRERVQYVGRIGVVFGQRTELWWDHPVAASFEWKRVVWNIPRPRYERMLALVRELLGLDVLARRRILSFIRELNREREVSVVVTSHDMAELEQLAGRIVLLHQGQIAFDGVFSELRRVLTRRRVLTLETASTTAPELDGAELISSDAGRHEYAFDSAAKRLSDLLEDASAQTEVFDVETHRAPIDQVVADLYEHWRQAAPSAGMRD
jgi:ABC-2 type transport system ATP-binding protein